MWLCQLTNRPEKLFLCVPTAHMRCLRLTWLLSMREGGGPTDLHCCCAGAPGRVRGGAQEEAQQPEVVEKGLPEAQSQVHHMQIQHQQLPPVRTSMPALASLGQVYPCPNPSRISSPASLCISGACGCRYLPLHSPYGAWCVSILDHQAPSCATTCKTSCMKERLRAQRKNPQA